MQPFFVTTKTETPFCRNFSQFFIWRNKIFRWNQEIAVAITVLKIERYVKGLTLCYSMWGGGGGRVRVMDSWIGLFLLLAVPFSSLIRAKNKQLTTERNKTKLQLLKGMTVYIEPHYFH